VAARYAAAVTFQVQPPETSNQEPSGDLSLNIRPKPASAAASTMLLSAPWSPASTTARGLAQTSCSTAWPVMERLRVREIDDDEGRRLVRIIRRAADRW
jgi:hypothetical protein